MSVALVWRAVSLRFKPFLRPGVARFLTIGALLINLYSASFVLELASRRSVSPDAPSPRRVSPNVPSPHKVSPDVPGQCFALQRVSTVTPCAPCVPFVTVAILGKRWARPTRFARSLRIIARTLQISQGCFTLHVYTTAAEGGDFWNALASAGGPRVRIARYPTDLPRNAYSGVSQWLELSRQKLELLEGHEARTGENPVWIDLDTLVVADLRCAIGRSPNFIASRVDRRAFMVGPQGSTIEIARGRTTTGDLWRADPVLRGRIRQLERDGMPPPPFDLQDYAGVVMNECDGDLVDLRAVVRDEGFAKGGPMAFGFDCWGGSAPKPSTSTLTIVNGTLHCRVKLRFNIRPLLPVATLSFHAPSFREMLGKPGKYFNTPPLWRWAQSHGIIQ